MDYARNNFYIIQSNRNLKDTTRYIQKNQIEPDTIKPEPEKGNRKKEFNFEWKSWNILLLNKPPTMELNTFCRSILNSTELMISQKLKSQHVMNLQVIKGTKYELNVNSEKN